MSNKKPQLLPVIALGPSCPECLAAPSCKAMALRDKIHTFNDDVADFYEAVEGIVADVLPMVRVGLNQGVKLDNEIHTVHDQVQVCVGEVVLKPSDKETKRNKFADPDKRFIANPTFPDERDTSLLILGLTKEVEGGEMEMRAKGLVVDTQSSLKKVVFKDEDTRLQARDANWAAESALDSIDLIRRQSLELAPAFLIAAAVNNTEEV